jgi:hypothetical protein
MLELKDASSKILAHTIVGVRLASPMALSTSLSSSSSSSAGILLFVSL